MWLCYRSISTPPTTLSQHCHTVATSVYSSSKPEHDTIILTPCLHFQMGEFSWGEVSRAPGSHLISKHQITTTVGSPHKNIWRSAQKYLTIRAKIFHCLYHTVVTKAEQLEKCWAAEHEPDMRQRRNVDNKGDFMKKCLIRQPRQPWIFPLVTCLVHVVVITL